MKIIHILLLIVFCLGCKEPSETNQIGDFNSFSAMLNHCKGTTVVIAVGHRDGYLSSASTLIVVIDSTGTTYSYPTGGNLGLQIGDTLKYSKR